MTNTRKRNLFDTIQEGVTFLDGVTIDKGDFEDETDFVDEIVSEFVRRLGLDTDQDIYSPYDGQVSEAIKALGWDFRMRDCLDALTFDQFDKFIWVPISLIMSGALRIASVYALIGVYFLEMTEEGQELMSSIHMPVMPTDSIMAPSYPGVIVEEIVDTLSKNE